MKQFLWVGRFQRMRGRATDGPPHTAAMMNTGHPNQRSERETKPPATRRSPAAVNHL
jgi:hypothetical protein